MTFRNMKHVINLLLVPCLAISLSACGISQADYDAPSTENSAMNSEFEPSSAENVSGVDETVTSESTDSMTDFFAELNAQAEELANNSSEIIEGDLYNAVIAIHPNIVLTALGDGTSLSISIFLDEQTPEDASKSFYDILNTICSTCALEETYSDLTFMMFVDDSFVATLTRIDYTSPNSFSSTPPFVIKEEYEEYLNSLYYSNDSSNDIAASFDAALDELFQQYNK